MMALDPVRLFARLAEALPRKLHRHACIVGSLAAAYHFRTRLRGLAVNTKDADLLVHPAGDVRSCRDMAAQLLGLGWRRKSDCVAQEHPRPAGSLRALRLLPPRSDGYFIELMGLPNARQRGAKRWTPVRLPEGWYGIPSFRCMRVIGEGRLRSREGLEYASPAMMALANLLAHPEVGTQRMSEPIGGRRLLRSAKDLGRILAMAWLTGREGTAEWRDRWTHALQACFPGRRTELARHLGDGFWEFLDRPDALEDARVSTDVGLLAGKGVTVDNLRAVGEQVWSDLVLPVRRMISRGRNANEARAPGVRPRG